jgi:hypothetical protein
VSVVSAGCVLWLERFQPLFVSLAVSTLAYQAWLVWRRPPHRRTAMMRLILWASFGTSIAVGVVLAGLWLRYR